MPGRLAVIGKTAQTKPNYNKTAAMLLAACREYFKEPANEQAYLDWKKNGQNKKDR